MIVTEIIIDMVFAAIAGMGFGAISNPPIRSFKFIAILASVGHVLRYVLMNYFDINISTASFFGALLVGFGSIILGRRNKVPATVLSIPALLPMIPGKFAYNMVFSLIMFMQNLDNDELKAKFMDMFFSNTIIAGSTLFLLAAGVSLPMLMFPKYTLSFTRNSKYY
ncbi:MAG: threonine/serine exporter family protein [Mangrovibacterium sp.]